MMKAIVRCINIIFEIGDYSKVQSSFIEPMLTSISNNQIA
jgi:hypothetical protein